MIEFLPMLVGAIVGYYLLPRIVCFNRSLDKGYGYGIISFIAGTSIFISILMRDNFIIILSVLQLGLIIYVCIMEQLYFDEVET